VAQRLEYRLVDLAAALRSGELDLLAYLEALEARIGRVDPRLHALLPEERRLERLRRLAEALLARYPEPASRPALFGVPVGVKDIFHVDGFPTRAGSWLPAELFQGPQAECVSVLEAAGALVLGKTVTTELAFLAPGPTRNPRAPGHTPGGSSSGSAAAVAAGLCPLALGTQTVGSLVRPAAFCGIVAFKPSSERVPRAGVVPLSPSLDHVGILTTDVASAALAAGVLCRDWRAAEVDVNGLPVLGVPEGPYLDRAGAVAQAHFRATLQRVAAAGFVVQPVPVMADFAAIVERHYRLVAGEAATVHAQWLSTYRERLHPETIALIERGMAVTAAELDAARDGREALRDELTAALGAHGIDAWIAPSAVGPAPEGLARTGDPVMNLPWTHAGLPVVGLPSGTNDAGLPLGVQLVGRWQADEAVLAWAGAVERVLGVMATAKVGEGALPGAG
jgi:Asp-tRNA(Asn)/Glu-tRNA(Gln) amidotransferase A subunit family amidase